MLFLLLHRDVPQRRETVAFALRPDLTESSARTELRRQLHNLSEYLPEAPRDRPFVLADRKQLQWNPDGDYWLDAEELETRLRSAQALLGDRDTQGAIAELTEAIALAPGDLLHGEDNDWLEAHRDRYRVRRNQALKQLAELHESAGDLEAAFDVASTLLSAEPLSEPTHRRLMHLHCALGNPAAALDQYDRCSSLLRETHDIAPTADTIALADEIRDGSFEPLKVRSEASRTPDRLLLPMPLTRFIGREREIDDIVAKLDLGTIVSLVGIGGGGKTRLALQTASQIGDAADVTVWWVDLSRVSDDRLVAQEVLAVMGASREGSQSPLDALVEAVADQRHLIVLDNCEHVRCAVSDLVQSVTAACPALRILATTRIALGVPGEAVCAVPPLATPDAMLDMRQDREKILAFESIQLLVDRIRLSWPSFELHDDRLRAASEICRRVEGIPLGLELAAARVVTMGLDETAHRLADDFEVLRGESRTLPDRHQSLTAALDWGYRLLSEVEQRALMCSATFKGDFTYGALRQVCSGWSHGTGDGAESVAQSLGRLVESSFVDALPLPDGAIRYRLLEVVRKFAEAHLETSGDASLVRQEHARHYMRLAERLVADGAVQADRFARLDAEHSNIRQALRWFSDHHANQEALKLVGAVWPFWYSRALAVVERQWIEELIADAGQDVDPALIAGAHDGALALAYDQADLAAAARHGQASFEIYSALGDQASAVTSLDRIAIIDTVRGQYETARDACERAVSIKRELGDEAGLANTISALGEVHAREGDLQEAKRCFEQSIAILGRLGGFGDALFNATRGVVLVARQQGDYHAARALVAEALDESSSTSSPALQIHWHTELGLLECNQGNYDEADDELRRALELSRDLGLHGFVSKSMNNLGEVALAAGRFETASTYFRRNIDHCRRIGENWSRLYSMINLTESMCREGNLSGAEASGDESLAAARELGARSLIAWALRVMAHVRVASVQLDISAEALRESLTIANSQGAKPEIARILDVAAAHAWAAGQPQRSARLAGASDAIRENIGGPRTVGERADNETLMSGLLDRLGRADLDHELVAGLSMSVDDAVAFALEPD